MWIVRLALRRPYTIAVMALLILVLGTLSLTRMIVDIFPAIDIPVVAVVWLLREHRPGEVLHCAHRDVELLVADGVGDRLGQADALTRLGEGGRALDELPEQGPEGAVGVHGAWVERLECLVEVPLGAGWSDDL